MGGIGHPALDIYLYVSVSLDHAFRRQYETEYLKTYFEEFSKYVTPFVPVTFDSFMEEFEYHRDFMVIGGLWVAPNVLSPFQVKTDGIDAFKVMDRKRHIEIASPDQPDDHPQVVMIRDRLVGFVNELNDKGVLDPS